MESDLSRVARVAFGLWLISMAPAFAQAPLPEDLTIASPAPDVPADSAAFSGAWGGDAWDGTTPNVLVVERVSADGSATVVYAQGDTPSWQIQRAWYRLSGKIVDGRLTITLPSGDVVDYRLGQNDELIGDQTRVNFYRFYVHLKRFSARDSAGIVAEAALPQQPIWQEIRIPVHSEIGAAAGQTLMLEATLFRTPLPGRRPLIVLNHGYAGGRPEEPKTPRILRFEEQARFFLALGDTVVVPMRKGQGSSEGPYLESMSVLPAMEVDSGVEDVAAVVDYMRAEPYVDPTRIVVAGASRGGMLSVVYAGRFPGTVAGVINFSGGWWADFNGGDTNIRLFSEAAHATKVPMLWLYADSDSLFPPVHAEEYVEAFRTAGGDAQFVEIQGIAGEGHPLFWWPDKWTEPVANYLENLSPAP